MNKRDPGVNINVGVVGTVFGWCMQGETEFEAAARLVLEIEMQANAKGDPRLHLQIKEEVPAMPGQSRLAATLATEVTKFINRPEMTLDFIAVIDEVLTQLRQAHEPLNPCPVVLPHPKGPCVFCVAYNMRDVLILQEENVDGDIHGD